MPLPSSFFTRDWHRQPTGPPSALTSDLFSVDFQTRCWLNISLAYSFAQFGSLLCPSSSWAYYRYMSIDYSHSTFQPASIMVAKLEEITHSIFNKVVNFLLAACIRWDRVGRSLWSIVHSLFRLLVHPCSYSELKARSYSFIATLLRYRWSYIALCSLYPSVPRI